VVEVSEKRARTDAARAHRCIRCGACVAVCPNGALQLEGMGAELFPRLAPPAVGYDALLSFLDGRRSQRVFKDAPVARELVEKVLEAAARAPMGFPPHTTGVLVLESPEKREVLFQAVRLGYEELVGAVRNPLIRPMVRIGAGAQDYHAIVTHILEIAEDATERFERRGDDRYTYRAPVVLIFHANRWDVAYRGNAYIVATYALLAAHALGLGATMLDIVAPVVNRNARLKKRWGWDKDEEAVVTVILGHPKYKYPRAVRRQLKSVKYV
jgi:nitroreductase